MKRQNNCCEPIFASFSFEDIRTASPPDVKGVYAIRVREKGKDIAEIVERVNKIIETLDWQAVGTHILSRIERLNNLKECSIIYIGSAGTRQASKHTLKGRYKDFSGRHTIMHPLWALLYFGWKLELGWKEAEIPSEAEKELKRRYKEIHDGNLPALVQM